MRIDKKQQLVESAKILISCIEQLLISHPEIIAETCRYCVNQRTCAECVEHSASRFVVALEKFEKAKICFN
jgi:hypothetical protein